jgi:hypothetical protein
MCHRALNKNGEFLSGEMEKRDLQDAKGAGPKGDAGNFPDSLHSLKALLTTKRELQHHNCLYESTTGAEAEIAILIDASMSRAIIVPNNCVSPFRMSSIEFLLPENGRKGPFTKSPPRRD